MARKLKGTAIQAGTISVTQLDNSVSTVIQTGGGPKISNIQVTDNSWTVLDDTAVDIAGGYILISGTGFVSGALVYFNQTPATSVAFVSSTALRVTVPAFAAGTYVVYVINPDGGSAIRVPGITASTNPAWQTGSSLGEIGDSVLINLSLIASDAVSYTVISGSLPPGLALNSSTGVISGTVTGVSVETVYTFTVRATDAQNQDSPRTFTVTVSVNDPYFKLTSLLISGEQGNSILRDSSVNNFNLTVFGDARASPFTPYGTGWSNYFDGTGDYLTTASNAALGFGTGDFTIEGWFYFTGTIGTYQRPWWFGDDNDNLEIFSSVIRFGGASETAITGPTAVANTWYHIAYTRQSGSGKLFVNGTQVGSTTASSYNSSARTFTLMATSGGANPSTGYVSNLRIVKGVAIYTGVFTPPTQPLATTQSTSANIAAITGTQTSLLTSCSNRLVDISSNSIAITRNGDARVASFNPFNITNTGVNGSMYFDGTGDYVTAPSNAVFGPSGDFTFESWLYWTGGSNENTLFCVDVSGGINIGLAFGTGGANWGIGRRALVVDNEFGTAPIKFTWNHLAVSRQSGTIRAFVNGRLVFSGANTVSYVAGPPGIACIATASTNILQGYISDARFVSAAVYTANFTPATSSLTAIANTQLLTLQYDQPHNNHTFLDSSSNQFLITRSGNATQGTFSPFSQSGWSVYFNGTTGNYLTVSGGILGTSSNTFTIECWVYRLSSNTYGMLFGDAVPTSYTNYWSFEVNSSNLLNFYWFDGGTKNVTGNTTIPINTWTHLALSVNNNAISLYVNGIQQTLSGTTTLTNRSGSNGYITIGQHGSPAVAYNGYISNLSFLSGTAKYSATFTPSSTKLLTNTINQQLLVCYGNNFNDFNTTNSAKSISVTGTPQVQAFSPFAATAVYNPTTHGGSAYFDGTGDYLSTTVTVSDFYTALGDFTFECWVYPLSFSGPQYSCPLFASTNDDLMLRAMPTSATSTSLNIYGINSAGGPAFGSSGTSGGTIRLNEWAWVVFTRESGVLNLWVNGTRVVNDSTYTSTQLRQTATSLRIGGATAGTNPVWNGYLSGVKWTSGAALYSGATISMPTSPPVSTNNRLLLNFTDAAILDRSSRSVIETQADAKVSSVQVKYGLGSMWFDGTGDILAIPDSRIFDLASLDWTIEFWMYRTVNATQVIFVKRANNTAQGMPLIYANTSSQIQVDFSGQTGLTSTTTVSLNSWVHIAVVRSGSGSNNVKIYFNGVADATTVSWTTLTTNSSPLYIGGDSNGNNFTGYLSDLRITRGYARYTNNFSPPSSAFKLK